MIPALLASVGVPVLVRLARGALSRIDNPVAKAAADALEQTDRAFNDQRIGPEQIEAANETLRALAAQEGANFRAAMRQVNRTMRTELMSEDAYVRRWRPTFGYAVAFTWVVQVGGLVYAIVAHPEHAEAIVSAMAGLSFIWGIALSVLGVNAIKRSQDKRLQAGATSEPGAVAGLIQRLLGGRPENAA